MTYMLETAFAASSSLASLTIPELSEMPLETMHIPEVVQRRDFKSSSCEVRRPR